MTTFKDSNLRTVELTLFSHASVSRPRRVDHAETHSTCERIPPPTQIVRVGGAAERRAVEQAQPGFVLVEFKTQAKSRSEPLADLSVLF